MREQPPAACIEPLRKALTNRNNLHVGKAADLVRKFQLTQLTPELLAAFDRFFDEPVKSDPQCWAKNALSRALAAFEYQEPEVFLRGMKHIQPEPSYGGPSDSAGTLRATCVLALVQCRSVRDPELLAHLVEMLLDKDKAVRVEVIRAIEQVGSPSAVLLLRMRAVLGSDEPEVLGACYSGVLHLEGASAIPWVARFLDSEDDAAGEAALAIAATHTPQGFHVLRDRLTYASDPWFCSVLLSAIALTRQDEALEFLLQEAREESLHAEAAIDAICRSAPQEEVMKRLEGLVERIPRLAHCLATNRLNR